MKKIAIFEDGLAVIDTESRHHVRISGKEPYDTVEATDENMRKFFRGKPKKSEIVVGKGKGKQRF